jgi:hypothetical protein
LTDVNTPLAREVTISTSPSSTRKTCRGLSAAIKAGVTYFGGVFVAAVMLGTFRVLVLVPHVGEATAVLFETPHPGGELGGFG